MGQTPELTTSRIDIAEFAEVLRSNGYGISVNQCVRAQEFLLSLARSTAVPKDPMRLASVLAPMFCTNPEEQRSFPQHFCDWYERRIKKPTPLSAGAVVRVQHRLERGFKRVLRSTRRLIPMGRKRWLMGLVGLVASVALLFACITVRVRGQVTGSEGQGVGSSIVFAGRAIETDGQGRFNVLLFRWQFPADFTSRSGTQTVTASVQMADAKKYLVIRVLPMDRGGGSSSASKGNPATAFRDSSGYSVHPVVVVAVFVVLGTGLSIIFIGVHLTRRFFRNPPIHRVLHVQTSPKRLFTGPGFWQLNSAFGREPSARLSDFDAERSIESTLRAGSLFSPVFQRRWHRPALVALVDRRSGGDHFAALADELLDRLGDGIVSQRFYFSADPTVCRSDLTTGSFVPVTELTIRYSDAILLLISDGIEPCDSISESQAMWFEELSKWRRCLALVPSAIEAHRADLLALAGFKVFEISEAGLAAFAEDLDESSAATSLRRSSQVYPPILEQSPSRWLDRLSPENTLVARLCVQLHRFLGPDDYRFLGGCARYPELRWKLTAHLAFALTGTRDVEERLANVTCLPWFRQGRMPDWFRSRLLSSLPPEYLLRTRAVIRQVLLTAAAAQGGLRLEAVRSASVTRYAGTNGIFSILQDHVALRVLLRGRVRRLDVAVPRRIWRQFRGRQAELIASIRKPILALAVVIFAVAFIQVGLGTSVMLAGYKLEALRSEERRLIDERHNLEWKEAELLAPDRLERLARDFDLGEPKAGNIVHLDEKSADLGKK